MPMRSSISNTKKFIQKTFENFKCLFANGYQKLPNSPNNTSINKPYTDLASFISHNNKTQNPNIIIAPPSLSSPFSLQKQLHAKPRSHATPKKQRETADDEQETLCSKPRIQIVRQKLKDLETMISVMSDTDHVSDIQEFLHYYSRLRCPAFIDIVEQFFMEMYSEFLVLQLEPPRKH